MIRTSPWLMAAVLGLCHGVSDCSAGFLLGELGRQEGLMGGGALLMLYNVLAFGGQLPLGVWLDRSGRYRAALGVSLGLMVLAMVLAAGLDGPGRGLLSVALAGLGSGLFHVAGGAMVLQARAGESTLAGMFAGPGVMGLALGGWMAFAGVEAYLVLAVILLIGLGVLALHAEQAEARLNHGEPHRLEAHDIWMMVVLMVIALRSAVWNIWEQVAAGDHEMLLAMALAAGFGKIAGGFAALRMGAGRWIAIALAAGAALLQFGSGRPVWVLVGIALVQSATGPTLTLLWRLMPRAPATVSGMGFGLAIALGGIPMLVGWSLGLGWTLPVLLTAAIAAAWVAWKMTRKRSTPTP